MGTAYMKVFVEHPEPGAKERFQLLFHGVSEIPRIGDSMAIMDGDVTYKVDRVIWPLGGDIHHADSEWVEVVLRKGA